MKAVRTEIRGTGIGFARFKRLLRLSFLAPSIVESILAGTQQIDMTVASINTITNIPFCWDEQQAMLAVG